jgi:stalled ribosome rescue protein Dom34
MEIFEKFKAEFSKGKASMGLLEIWMLANQGRIKTLLVEENYHQPAKFQNNTPIFIDKTEGPYEIDDLVDELVEVVF